MRCEHCGGTFYRDEEGEVCILCSRPRNLVRPTPPTLAELRVHNAAERMAHRKYRPGDWE